MSRIDKELLKTIHSGKCFLLVGSGASIDAGYPSWSELALSLLEENKTKYSDEEYLSIEKRIDGGEVDNLLSFFDNLEKRVGKDKIVSQILTIFNSVETKESEIYSIISSWPISVFLTTNYDSELSKYLERQGLTYLEKTNSERDFRSLSTSAYNSIYKIHGDFTNPESLILSKKDYNNVLTSPAFDYWRKKIQSLLMVCDFVFVGYSAKDPDFKEQLDIVTKYSDPNKPKYLFATGLSGDEIERLRVESNIKVVSYDNSSGDHSSLRRLLKNYDRFIPSRGSALVNKSEEQLLESEIASSVFIFIETYSNDKIIIKALLNYLLHVVIEKKVISFDSLIEVLQDRGVSSDIVSIRSAIDKLEEDGYIKSTPEKYLVVSEKGKEVIQRAEGEFSDYKARFRQYCSSVLTKKGCTKNSVDNILAHIDHGIVILFEKRGLEITKMIFNSDNSADVSATFDIADCLSVFEKTLVDDEYDFFIDLLFLIFEKPTKEIRDYLAIISNGFFSYHFLGHSERAREKRLGLIRNDKIYLDSSILIPLFAESCQNNKYANDLIVKIKKYNPNLCVTHRLLREVINHAEWAVRRFADKEVLIWDSYYNVVGSADERENLFVSGALNWTTKEGYRYFDSYFSHVFGENYKNNIEGVIEKKLCDYGIQIIDATNFSAFQESDYYILDEYKTRIMEDRQCHNSYRSDFQCETEAELLLISSYIPINFLTHTTNLKRFDLDNRINHWFPEGLFRFLQMNDDSFDLDNLFNCMISGLYSSGLRPFNSEDIERMTNPFIHQAELRIDEISKEEKKVALKYLSKERISQEKEDLTLPFYSLQIESLLQKEYEAKKETANTRINQLRELEKKVMLSQKEKNEYERMKNRKVQKAKQASNKRKRKKGKR